ncbi:MAG: DNA phosphorothioation system sulfurtransferase DndC [Planctomycetes bacterium]|nr:DNA phosphorothioation system sulfurtransferase DndC [Planctomycetota bacterium]
MALLARFGHTERSEIRADFAPSVLADLRASYLSDDRPWVLGFSGGKDSTALLQFVYYMLARLPASDRKKPVFVLASDTRVEAPSISQRIRKELALIGEAAEQDRLPITTHLVFPKLNDSFWVGLIGRGYPSPSTKFRWCTDRLKILPSSHFIKTIVDRTGAVVVVLGARKDESATRAQTMAASKIEGQRFRPHTDLPKAWVYTPLEDLSVNEVWTYLLQVPSPWGGDNRALVALYKQAGGGECPLVIDTSTPSCGQSRFGCWVCTVVEKDRSMEALVDAGEDHLEPLLDFRDYLKDVRNKAGARYDLRRNGSVPIRKSTGEQMTNTGPFTHVTRRDLLRRLLEAQQQSGLSLIDGDELAAIQEIWTHEEHNPQPPDTVVHIWKHVYEKTPMPPDNNVDTPLSAEDELLRKVCQEQGVSFEMMLRLRDVEERFSHLKRRHGLPEEMREIVRQETKDKDS